MHFQSGSKYRNLTVITLIIIVRLFQVLGKDDSWGNWSDYTECSRTCGSGVQQRTRSCLTGRSARSQCRGQNIQYQSCNVQECPKASIDFRSYQCNYHGFPPNIFNDSNSLLWKSYFDPDKPCELVCKNENGNIKNVHETVIDGTRCDNHDSYGMCIGGICKPVGCDHLLNSLKMEDRCLVCGGNGESCQTVSGSTSGQIHKFDLKITIATIPINAMTVTLILTSPSPGMLELVSDNGKILILSEILNRNVARRAGDFAGTYFTHKVIENGIKFGARGPLNESLQLQVRLKKSDSVVEFQYSIAKSKVLKMNLQHRYTWIFGKWTSCSQQCGIGYQLRAVICIDHETGGTVSTQFCPQNEIPVRNQSCSEGTCQLSSRDKFKWIAGHWGECSVDCGLGEQTQIMHCIKIDITGNSNYTSDDVCLQHVDVKPVLKRLCFGESDYCPYWATGSWNECSVTCGFGSQTRTVYCQRDSTETSKDLIALDDSLCPYENRPQQVQACFRDQCADGTNNHIKEHDVGRPDVDCRNTRFGCCPDNRTFAKGSSYFGCIDQVVSGDFCQLPNDRGPCANYTIKWYFDTKELVCLRFWYGGCHGNDNRFDDSDSCSAHCPKKLPYTKPIKAVLGCAKSEYGCCPNQLTPAEGPNYHGCQRNCEDSTHGCCTDGVTPAEGPSQEGCDFGSGEIPCDFTVYGCCADGITAVSDPLSKGCGDILDSEDTRSKDVKHAEAKFVDEKCTAPVSRDLCTEYSMRWRFDNQKQKCVSHWWGGCEDNRNVFESQGDCEVQCMNTVVIMNSNVKDPDKCTAPVSRDLCTEYSVKWRYDNTKQNCARHWWGGCKDNGNIFESQGDCEAECMNTVVVMNPDFEDSDFVNICDMRIDVGPCTDHLLRYYYEPKDRQCRVFFYGGCQGNENNFVQIEDCQRECLRGDVRVDVLATSYPQEHETLKFPAVHVSSTTTERTATTKYVESKDPAEVCQKSMDIGPCKATVPRFFFDPLTRSCKNFLYGGCYGNLNNFATKEACNQKCSDYKIVDAEVDVQLTGGNLDVCQLNSEPGSCRGYNIKWYYSAARNRCARFVYTGCDGNGNQFDSEKECNDRCSIEDVTNSSDRSKSASTIKSSQATELSIFFPKSNIKNIGAEIQSHQGIFIEGDTVHLLCKGTGYPVPQLEWIKEGNVLKSEGKVTVRKGDLIIRAVSIEDSGLYKCIAFNEQDKAEDVSTVHIKFHDPQTNCEDIMGRTKCQLIVSGRLCGFQIFANKCCQSCRRATVF